MSSRKDWTTERESFPAWTWIIYANRPGTRRKIPKTLNKNLFEAALRLPKVKVRECLVPRKEIEGID